MADLGGQFDAQSVDPLGDYQPLPAGEYRCVIVKSEWKPTKSGNGRFIEFGFQVVDGEYQGRMVFDRLNLENPNQQAVNIARSALSSICRAVGKLSPRDTAELHDVPLMVKVAVRKREDNGEPSNEVKGYCTIGEARETATAGASESSNSTKPNWM